MTHHPDPGPAGMDVERALAVVRTEMADQPLAVQVEYRIDRVIAEMDELCALASNPETAHLLESQKIGVGQIATRANLILSFLMARKPTGLRIVQNG
jgi:hypothetical protein